MWTLVFRKIINNKWMMLCLLFGFIVVVAMVSAVPMYSDAILQRMLDKDLETYQASHAVYTGLYTVEGTYNAFSREDNSKERAYYMHKEKVEDELIPQLNVKIDVGIHILTAANMQAKPDMPDGDDGSVRGKSSSLVSIVDLADHVTITAGRLYEPGLSDEGYYEAIVTQDAYDELALNLNSVYQVASATNPDDYVLIQVVGVFTIDDGTSPFWYISGGISTYSTSFLIDYDTCQEILFQDFETIYLSGTQWRYAIDYTSLEISDLDTLVPTLQQHETEYNRMTGFTGYRVPMLETLVDYNQRAVELKTTLWVILVPILMMLCMYIFMVSQIIVKNEENEISVMRSRGASGTQIFLIYLLESVVLGLIAFAVGPFLGFFLCSILGSANGFLEFVGRKALPVKMVSAAYLYSAAAVLIFLITMLIPAVGASRTTIVERKRKRSRFADQPFWKKFFLDFITLGVAVYGYYNYQSYTGIITATGKSAVNVQIDPLLFLISSLFIIGAGLLFLRIYPYLIRFVFFLGRRHWSPGVYASFIQVGRSGGREQFLMIFLILSIAVGIFSANTARTLNQNIEYRLDYATGADVVLHPYWNSIPAENPDGSLMEGEYIYIEPQFTNYQEIEGAEAVAKVYTSTSFRVQASESISLNRSNVTVMGIEPASFSQVTWSRDDLFYPYHINNYLQLLVDAPRAALVSTSLRDQLALQVGDTIKISTGAQSQTELIVYAFVDYWPSINPYQTVRASSGSGDETALCDFLICNLDFLQSKFTKEPYDVWIKKADGVTDSELYDYIWSHSELQAESVDYLDQQIIEAKNDPLLQGFNGMLTLGFIITMFVCVIGFLIYWILSIRTRTLQFGVFRAMGMSVKNVIGMILCEQGLISLVSILAGVVLGGITSDLFVPMLEMVYSVAEQVPEFVVVATRADYGKIYLIIGVMLALGVAILSRIIARTKIDQALKLGED